MFAVINDIIINEFNSSINENTIMIGDTWHDKTAAENFGIKFLEAK